ncbi:hypothetical protein [Metabacillus fastidiosus]|uniref:hypothetical protein n=1 Tax=Metabacillus fastidiosus TaxID=1458 RepID=UPI003D2A3C43
MIENIIKRFVDEDVAIEVTADKEKNIVLRAWDQEGKYHEGKANTVTKVFKEMEQRLFEEGQVKKLA